MCESSAYIIRDGKEELVLESVDVLENEEDPFSGGMTFAVQPRGKKVHLLIHCWI